MEQNILQMLPGCNELSLDLLSLPGQVNPRILVRQWVELPGVQHELSQTACGNQSLGLLETHKTFGVVRGIVNFTRGAIKVTTLCRHTDRFGLVIASSAL